MIRKPFCLLLALAVIIQFTSQEYFNQNGLLIEKDGERFNYHKIDFDNTPIRNNFYAESDFSNSLVDSSITSSGICRHLWQDAIMGTCIGRNNNLISYDVDNDGIMELIASANAYGANLNGFWYVLKFDPQNQSYYDYYSSFLYHESISKLRLADYQNDGQMELLLARGNIIEVFSLQDFSLLDSDTLSQISGIENIEQIRYADIDSDGYNEIVVSSDNDLLILNSNNLNIEAHIEMSAGDFDIANVDDDSVLETVFTHGLTLEVNAFGNYTVQSDFRPDEDNPTQFIELADVDGDGVSEAVISESWYSLLVYDVDLSILKYDIQPNLDIDVLYTYDIDNDGASEILYGDGQWGNIYAHSGETGELYLEISNPEHGCVAISIGDFDGDSDDEIIWSSGCFSTGADHLHFYDIETQVEEWTSLHQDAPFYALKVFDVDEDGQNEIIAISNESDAGFESGILTIYDAVSKEIEFQSDGEFFSSIWTGIYDFEIVDYANDGDIDIVLAAGETYDGKFWVVDGDTHTIELEHLYPFSEDVSEFYVLAVEDLNFDGTSEFIAVGSEKLRIINSEDFTIEWESSWLNGFNKPVGVEVGNLNADPNSEIVVCKGFIYKFEGSDFSMTQSNDSYYTALKLFDWNEDGTPDILAGNPFGQVEVLSGNSLEQIDLIDLDGGYVGAIEVIDLSNDGVEELVVTIEDFIFFISSEGDILKSQPLTAGLGRFGALQILDYDFDGNQNILIGTEHSILELDRSCGECLWFEADFNVSSATCEEENGIIQVTSTENIVSLEIDSMIIPYTELIENLAEGSYVVSAMSENNCKSDELIVIENSNSINGNHCEVFLDLPNVISPNDDGHNDLFRPIRSKGVLSMETSILNRWGKEIYYTKNPDINWKGEESPEGTYFYIVSFKDVNQNLNLLKGTVTIIR